MESQFKQSLTFEHRHRESRRIRSKYPDRVPIIVEKSKNSSIPDLDKHKFLVPHDITIGQFMLVIRKRIKLTSDQAIYVFANNSIPTISETIISVYDKCKDEDGFLYITIAGESTFGYSPRI